MEQLAMKQHLEIPRISQGTKKAWVKIINQQDNSAWYVTEFDGKTSVMA